MFLLNTIYWAIGEIYTFHCLYLLQIISLTDLLCVKITLIMMIIKYKVNINDYSVMANES